jgi:hypothetical protein
MAIVQFQKATRDLQHLLGGSPVIAATLARRMLPDGVEFSDLVPDNIDDLLTRLAGKGQANSFDRLDCPAPKLLIACAVVELCRRLRRPEPSSKDPDLLALCAALLCWSQEQAGDPAPVSEAQESQWLASLRQARWFRMTGAVDDKTMAVDLIRDAVEQAFAQVPHGAGN